MGKKARNRARVYWADEDPIDSCPKSPSVPIGSGNPNDVDPFKGGWPRGPTLNKFVSTEVGRDVTDATHFLYKASSYIC